MARGPRTAALPRPKDTAADNNSVGTLLRQSNGANGTSPKNGMHLRREYVLLVPEEPEGSRANSGTWARGDDHGATRGTAEEGRTETPMEVKTGQCALLARGMQDDGNKAQIPPDRLRALNACGHPVGEGGGGTLTRQRSPTACSQRTEGDPPTWQRATLARGHGREEVGGPLTQQRAQTARAQGSEGTTPARPCAAPERSQGGEEEGEPPQITVRTTCA